MRRPVSSRIRPKSRTCAGQSSSFAITGSGGTDWCRWDDVRVIGGEFRSRLLQSLPGLDVRPTPDRLREALFNVLASKIGGIVFADVYAGTGAVGIEALSRGASRAIFLEQSRPAVNVIHRNLKSLGI